MMMKISQEEARNIIEDIIDAYNNGRDDDYLIWLLQIMLTELELEKANGESQ